MRVLLDENLDLELKPLFDSGFDVQTVADCAWQGMKNGALMRAAMESGFEVFVTRDKNLVHQQNLSQVTLGIVVIRARNSAYPTIARLIPRVNEAIRAIRPGEIIFIEEPPK